MHMTVQLVEALCYKPEGLIPNSVTGIFSDNPSSCTMTLKSTQPLTEMCTRKIAWGCKSGQSIGLTIWPPSCAECLEPGTLNLLEPSVTVQVWKGIALPLPLCNSSQNNPNNVTAIDLTRGKYSRAKMATHSGFWVGDPLAEPKQSNCKNLESSSGILAI
jgi:hypothetical protein